MTWGIIAHNALVLFGEGLAAGIFVLLGAIATAAPGVAASNAGFGYGFAALILTAVFLKHTGAMITPGAAMLRYLLNMFNLEKKRKHSSLGDIFHVADDHHHHAGHWHMYIHHAISDFVMMLLTIGFQLGGSLLGVLIVKHLDKTAFVKPVTFTAPFGNLLGHNGSTLLALWVLNSIVLLVYGVVTCSMWCKKSIKHYIKHKYSDKAKYTEKDGDKMLDMYKVLVKKDFWYRWGPAIAAMFGAFTVCVLVSYTLGTGSVLSFAADLALAVVITKHTSHLWLSALGQILGALTVALMLALFWVTVWLHRHVKHWVATHVHKTSMWPFGHHAHSSQDGDTVVLMTPAP
jgi:hypothetical protein